MDANTNVRFSGDPKDFNRFIKQFELQMNRVLVKEKFRYENLSEAKPDADNKRLNEYLSELKLTELRIALGEVADTIFQTFTPAEQKDYDKVVQKFKQFYEPKTSKIFSRVMFAKTQQKDGQNPLEFLAELETKILDCEFESLKPEEHKENWLMVLLIIGLKDRKLSEILTATDNLNLTTAKMKIMTYIATQKENALIHRAKMGENSEISYVKKNNKTNCYRCGKEPYSKEHKCPALNVVCHKCQYKGHYQQFCNKFSEGKLINARNAQNKAKYSQNKTNQKRVQNVYRAENSVLENSEENCHELGVINFEENCLNIGKSSKWIAETIISKNKTNKKVNFKIDTGAVVSCLPESLYCSNFGPIKKSNLKLVGAGQNGLATLGTITVKIAYKDQIIEDDLYVIKNLKTPLLGETSIEKLDLIARIANINQGNDIKYPKIEYPISDTVQNWPEKFPNLFTGLGCMKGSYHIQLNADTKPYSVPYPRRIPFAIRESVRNELEHMVNLKIITPITEPTEWCAPMVPVPKPGGLVRITNDYTELNKSVIRERTILPTVEESLEKISGGKYFSTIDCNSGFHQLLLTKESSKLTTFITPFGRYRYLRLCMGICSAPEVFSRRVSQILDGVLGVAVLMDDICVSGKTKAEHDERLTKVLNLLKEAGLTLNPKKCQFNRTTIKYLGYIVDGNGIRPDNKKLEAIKEYPTPKNITELRRFLGMVNQLAKFIKDLPDKTKALRELLTKKRSWTWSGEQEKAFKNLKDLLLSSEILVHYDVNGETLLSTDACQYGLGAVLYQKRNSEWRPVAYASRTLAPAESRYAIIEKEALAVTWGCEKFSQYLIGRQFKIQTDHRPLVAVLDTKRLDEVTPRLQRFRLRLLRFDYSVSYVPGKDQQVPDAFSRAPLVVTEDETLINAVEEHSIFCLKSINISDNLMQKVRNAQREDQVLKVLKDFLKANTGGRPDKRSFPPELRAYFPVFDELSIVEDTLLKGQKLIIADAMIPEMLNRIHEGHQGINRCLRLARESIWWLGMTRAIEQTITNCRTCCKFQAEKSQPLISTEVPLYPWQKIGIDFFAWNNSNYILLVDYLSRWIEIKLMHTTTSTATIKTLKVMFSRYGIPQELRSDNGPQFSSKEFKEFCLSYDIRHVTSSPLYPQSNGAAERAVKTAKTFLTKCKDSGGDLNLALLNYRTTPLEMGLSPADIMFGRKLRTRLPQAEITKRIPDIEAFRIKDQKSKEKTVEQFNSRHRAQRKKELEPNDEVYLFKEHIEGRILQKTEAPRSYDIQTPDGVVRRTRDHINPLPTKPREGEEEMKDRQASPKKDTNSSKKPVGSMPKTSKVSKQPSAKKQSFLTKILSPNKGESERESPSPKKPVPLRQSARSNKGVPPDRF